jgi:hypothetical protein
VEAISGNQSDRFKHTQSKALKVHVSNASTADAMGLTVRYFYFGKTVNEGETAVLEKGERKANVLAHATVVVEAPEIEMVYTEEHGKRTDGKGGPGAPRGNFSGRQKNARYRTVEATGTKVTGYGVQVLSGSQIVAESFSERDSKR